MFSLEQNYHSLTQFCADLNRAQIRVASWSLFKAIPVISSIGVTSPNGLTALYARGGLYPEEDSQKLRNGPIFVFTKSTDERSPYYVESVDASTGKALGDPEEYYFKDHIKDRKWFRSALSIPIGATAWHVEKSQISESSRHLRQEFIDCTVKETRSVPLLLAVDLKC